MFSHRCGLWHGHVTADALGQVPAGLLVAGPWVLHGAQGWARALGRSHRLCTKRSWIGTSSRVCPRPEHKLSCSLSEHTLIRGCPKPVLPPSTQTVWFLLLQRISGVEKVFLATPLGGASPPPRGREGCGLQPGGLGSPVYLCHAPGDLEMPSTPHASMLSSVTPLPGGRAPGAPVCHGGVWT